MAHRTGRQYRTAARDPGSARRGGGWPVEHRLVRRGRRRRDPGRADRAGAARLRRVPRRPGRAGRPSRRRGALFFASSAGGVYRRLDRAAVHRGDRPATAHAVRAGQAGDGRRPGVVRRADRHPGAGRPDRQPVRPGPEPGQGPGPGLADLPDPPDRAPPLALRAARHDAGLPVRRGLRTDDRRPGWPGCAIARPGPGRARVVTKIFGSGRSTTVGGLLGESTRLFRKRPRLVLGASPAAAGQVRDLRLQSTRWPELDRLARTPLPVGIAATAEDVGRRLRAAG